MRVSAEPRSAIRHGRPSSYSCSALVATLWPRRARRAGHRVCQGELHEVRVPHPDVATCGWSRPSMSPRTRPGVTRSPSDPHALWRAPYGVAAPSTTSALRPCSARRDTSSPTRMSAGAGCRRASSSTCTPHRPEKRPADIDESSDAFDTIDWLIKNVPNHNGRVGMWGISYPGFYTRRDDRRPPCPEGGLAPAPDLRLVRRRRLAPQRRPSGPTPSTSWPARADPARSRRRQGPLFNYGTPDGTSFSFSWDRSPSQQEVFQGRGPVLERPAAARELR